METARHKTATRSVSPQPKPAAAPQIQRRATSGAAKVQCQSAMKVSSPHDPAEKEADRTAQKIMRMAVPESSISYVRTEKGGVFRQVKPEEREKDKKIQRSLQSPYIQRFANTGIFTQRNLDDRIQRKAEGQPNVASNVAAEIQASTATGAPLPLTVRRFMEPRFQANFSPVKIHTGDRSAKLNRQLNAQAFTVGNQIFFGKDKFKPDSQEGKELIAHELTHTIQQGAAIQRREAVSVTPVSVTQQAPVQVQRLGLSDALDYFADKANLIPGFRMFTIILGVNPINMSRVERSAANILRAIVEFLPGGGLITQALDNYGVFDRVGAWIEQQIQSLGMTGAVIRQAIDQFLDSLSWTDIFDLGGVWNRAKRIFTDPIDRIISFGRNLVTGIIRFVKEAILRPLARLAEGTRGYDLLKAVLGQDPITGDPVPRNADTLIGGFMKLIGQEEVWNNLKRANAVARAWAWFQGALAGLLGFVRQIPTLFIQALQSLEIADIVLLPRAFVRVGTVFANFVGQFISWAGQQVMSLLQIIFEVVAPGAMPYIRQAAGAFRSIIQNPIGFVGNLVRAGIQGFRQFATNFLTHLRGSLIGWLTGAMSGANIYIPQAFTLREIIKFVLSVLGLTWQNIRQKLVRVIGEPAVQALETGFDIVMTLVTQGPAAAWEKIQESLSNLRDMVMEQIMTFVRDRVVQAAITRLITSLNPAGAFIQAIIATYNTIMFFVERLRQIAQVAMAFIDSVSAIASGVLTAAANRVETTMAGLLTLVISFLARIAGLGRVSDAVTNIINRVRAPIDRALDRVVDWIVTQARRLGSFFRGRDARSPEEKQRDLDRAVRELRPQIQRLLARGIMRPLLSARLAIWRRQYRLTTLTVEGSNIVATINPQANLYSVEEVQVGQMLEPILLEVEQQYLAETTAPGTASAANLAQARTDVQAGRPVQQRLSANELIQLQREIVAGQVPVPPLGENRRGTRTTDLTSEAIQGTRVQMRDRGSTVPGQIQGGQGLFVTRAGTYAFWEEGYVVGKDATRGGRTVNVQMGNITESGTSARPELQAQVRDVVFLRDVVEPGRIPTLMAANRVARGLVDASSASELEMTVGRMAGAFTGNSAAAAMRDFYGRTPVGPDRTALPSSALDEATRVRQGSVGRIFIALREALRGSGSRTLRERGGRPLVNLATAFRAWMRANLPRPGSRPRTEGERERLANNLRQRLIEFLRSQEQQ